MKYSFWKLIEEQEIEIPIIQRDYAQGRLDERVTEIRKRFINDLLTTIENTGKELNLDFVYGKTHNKKEIEESERNQENVRRLLDTVKEYSKKIEFDFDYVIKKNQSQSNNDKVLVPLDGQQRLTTLFLLHFYLGTKLNKDLSVLHGFNFKTRKSSSEFCDKLVENCILLSKIIGTENIASIIEDQRWFYTNWKKDPTVAGMLVTLDEIERQINNGSYNLENCWVNLTKNNAVQFDFFDLKERGLEDELYVKMNARGKHLTDFENFKAWLQGYVKNEKIDLSSNWEYKLDKDWLDIFWCKNKDKGNIDATFLQFFKNIASVKKIEQFTLLDASKENEKKLYKELSNENFLSSSYYENNIIFDKPTLEFIFETLTILELKNSTELDEIISTVWQAPFYDGSQGLFSDALTINYNQLNLLHKTFIYAVLHYLKVVNKPFNEFSAEEKENFVVWLKTLRNIAYNTRIDDDEQFFRAIKAIKELGNSVIDLKSYLLSIGDNGVNGKWITFFLSQQQKEEYLKLIELDDTWKQSIESAEKHPYFYGQIGFIIELSKNQNDQYDLIKFNELYKRFAKLFDEVHFDNQFVVQRALLCIGEPKAAWMKHLEGSDRYSFYNSTRTIARQRDENWRSLFNNSEQRKVLVKLADQCDCSTLELLKIIESGKTTIFDWRHFFIADPIYIEKCNQRLITWTQYGDSIYLLNESRLSHYHRELRSYALFKSLYKEELKEELQYIQVKNASENPYLLINKGEKKYQIVFNSTLKKFQFKMETENASEYRDLSLDVPFYKEISAFNIMPSTIIATATTENENE